MTDEKTNLTAMSTEVQKLDVGVQLLQRISSSNDEYAVIVTAGDYSLALLDVNMCILIAKKSEAANLQVALGRILFTMAAKGVPPIAFIGKDAAAIKLVISVRFNSKQLAHLLVPVTVNDTAVTSIAFMNKTHAHAYAAEFIDRLLPGIVDWRDDKLVKIVIQD